MVSNKLTKNKFVLNYSQIRLTNGYKFLKYLFTLNLIPLIQKILLIAIDHFTRLVGSNRVDLISYNNLRKAPIADSISKIKQERHVLLTNTEAYQIYTAVKHVKKIKDDIVEVGVYKGGSAAIISEAKGYKTLHLFDTFEGIPSVKKIDTSNFYKGQYIALFDDVKKYLTGDKKYKNIFLYKGLFPKTATPIEKKSFSFVHLDVDTYTSTVNCLKFFYSRMNKGGIILSHDYTTVQGVTKAIDNFFKRKPEPIIELPGSQCLIVKL